MGARRPVQAGPGGREDAPRRQARPARRARLARDDQPAHRHPHERADPPGPERRRSGRRLSGPPLRQRRRRRRPQGSWELVTAADLEAAAPEIKDGDIVVIVTGWHHKYSDGLEYFGEAPGLSKDAAEWLVDKNPKLVAVDTPQVDHPLATSMGPHRGGPQMKRLAGEYQAATGLDPKKEHGSGTPPTRRCSRPASRRSSRSAATSTSSRASAPRSPRRRGSSSTATPVRCG